MSEKILYIEDNEANRVLLRYLLEANGYEYIDADNAEAGLGLAEQHRPDLILMDLQLPGMDGCAARRLLKDKPETRDIRVIAVTAFAMNSDRERARAEGFDGFVSRPVDLDQMLETIKKHIGR